jgi:hypothetical protein
LPAARRRRPHLQPARAGHSSPGGQRGTAIPSGRWPHQSENGDRHGFRPATQAPSPALPKRNPSQSPISSLLLAEKEGLAPISLGKKHGGRQRSMRNWCLSPLFSAHPEVSAREYCRTAQGFGPAGPKPWVGGPGEVQPRTGATHARRPCAAPPRGLPRFAPAIPGLRFACPGLTCFALAGWRRRLKTAASRRE